MTDADQWNDPPGVHEDDDQDADVSTATVGLDLAGCFVGGVLLALPLVTEMSAVTFLAGPGLVATMLVAWRWAVAYERRGRGGDGA